MDCSITRTYIKNNKSILPDYWHNKFSYETIDAVCNMLARSCHSNAEIAELFECPIELIGRIKRQYKKRIAARQKEYAEMRIALHNATAIQLSGNPDIFDLQNVLDDVSNRCTGKR